MDSPLTGIKLVHDRFSGFGHLLIGSVLSNKQTLILGHSKSDGDTPTELINLRNFCSDVSVPRLKLLESQAGVFPGRRFQLDL